MKEWGKQAFATKEEAMKAAELVTKEHINILRGHGLNINDEGKYVSDGL